MEIVCLCISFGSLYELYLVRVMYFWMSLFVFVQFSIRLETNKKEKKEKKKKKTSKDELSDYFELEFD